MIMKTKYQRHYYFALVIFLSIITVRGEAEQSTDTDMALNKDYAGFANDSDNKHIGHINIDRLATESLVDNVDKFEAILYDYQSQENIGHLYWDHSDSEGKIEFEYGEIKEQIYIQFASMESVPISERYEALLLGLHEAGVAWISQYKKSHYRDAPNNTNNEEKGLKKHLFGSFDWVSPRNAIGAGTLSHDTTRYAAGWAYDPNRPMKSVWVHIYAKAARRVGDQQKYIAAVYANRVKEGVNHKRGIPGNHGWKVKIPEGWDADGVNDKVGICSISVLNNKDLAALNYCSSQFTAYCIDIQESEYRQLANIPQVITFKGNVSK
jgi:hypothetical protein